jgi:hypothetical protein
MAAALRQIAESPPPAADEGAARLLADLEAGMEEQRLDQLRRQRELDRAHQRLAAIESTRTFRARSRVRRLLASLRR